MRETSIAELRKNIGNLIDLVNITGETIVVTKHGKPAAEIVPVEKKKKSVSHDKLIELFKKTQKNSPRSQKSVQDIMDDIRNDDE